MKPQSHVVQAAVAVLAAFLPLVDTLRAQEDEPPRPRLLAPEGAPGDGDGQTGSRKLIIAPKGDGAEPVEPTPRMPRYGTSLVEMPVRLEVTPEGTSVTLLEEPPAYVPDSLVLLPSPLREAMEDVEASNPLFVVSGRVTVFRNRCYLLPTRALLVEQPAQGSAERTEDARAVEAGPEQEDPATQASRDEPESSGQVEADDIMSRLLDKAGVRPIVPTRTTGQARPVGQADDALPAAAIEPEATGGIVVNRFVYVTAEPRTGWYQARFRSDNTLRKAPIRLLPNRLLQKVVPSQEALRIGAFQVSGDVLVYRGRRYLLLRKAVAKRDLNL